MLSKIDLGTRVVVRRRVGERHFSDVLGQLVALGEKDLTVLTDLGEVTVPYVEITAAKQIPPRRTKYSEIAALERAAVPGWPPLETEPLGDWILRAGAGWTNRGNSALVLGDPRIPLAEAFARVEAWYAARGLPARFALPLPLAGGVDRALEEAGWESYLSTAVLTRSVGDPGTPSEPGVELADEPDADWLDLVAGHKGALPPAAHAILTGPERVAFASVRLPGPPDGRLAAIGRGAVAEGWLGLSLLQVLPEFRRQGHAVRIVARLLDWGRDQGATRAYLQVEEANEPAIALYERLGFTRHHRYVHRRRPSP